MVEPWVGVGGGGGGLGISKVAERLKKLRMGLGWEEMEWEVQLTYLVSPAFGQVL